MNLVGQRVQVYFNLHTRSFSVRQRGRVIAHVPEIYLSEVEFRVSEAGRQRVLRERRKNVHAYVVGTVVEKTPVGKTLVTYNPFRYTTFVKVRGHAPVHTAKSAVLRSTPRVSVTI